MENKNVVYVKEPTFLSPIDIHFRNLSNIQRKYAISELKKVKENIETYRVECESTMQKSR